MRPLYESIQDDPRHTEVETVGIRSITVRRFPEWGMGHLPAELATTAAREAFRVAHTPAAEWRDDALAKILDEFERALAQTQTA